MIATTDYSDKAASEKPVWACNDWNAKEHDFTSCAECLIGLEGDNEAANEELEIDEDDTRDLADIKADLAFNQMVAEERANFMQVVKPRTDFGGMALKDSGTRTEFETGAVRDGATGKGRFDLMPCHALLRVAQHMENGAKKYADRNWEKGIPTNKYIDSAQRHILAYQAGYRDEDHLAAGAWNLLCMIETEHRIATGRLPASLLTLPAALPGSLLAPEFMAVYGSN